MGSNGFTFIFNLGVLFQELMDVRVQDMFMHKGNDMFS
jgi:hypothetical protein